MRGTRNPAVVAAVCLAIAWLFTASPAGASVTAAVGFDCVGVLPSFPTPAGSGSCEGIGRVDGIVLASDGNAYAVEGSGPLAANFSYAEPCPTAGVPPLVGTASGTATVTDLHAVRLLATTSAVLSASFNWTRLGAVAVVLASSTVIFGNGATGAGVLPGVGLGAFEPDPVDIAGGGNTCPAGDHVHFEVIGVGAHAA